jgi:hypothetical protein
LLPITAPTVAPLMAPTVTATNLYLDGHFKTLSKISEDDIFEIE